MNQNRNNVYNQYERRYKPIIENAKKEQSAKGQCKWIIAMFEILILNHLPHMEQVQKNIRQEMRKSTRKIMLFLSIVMAVVLGTNPQVADFISKICIQIFR